MNGMNVGRILSPNQERKEKGRKEKAPHREGTTHTHNWPDMRSFPEARS